jgi:hypothetical protein
MLKKRARKRALIIGLAARLAHDLSAGMAGVLPSTTLTLEGGRLALALPAKFAALDGEAVRKRLRALAAELECDPEIRIAGEPVAGLSPLARADIELQSEEVS